MASLLQGAPGEKPVPLEDLQFVLKEPWDPRSPADKNFGNLTYGEILPYSLEKLIRRYPLWPSDRLLDLGAGLGKPLLQFFMQSPVHTVHGIELDPVLYAGSLPKRAALAARFPHRFEGRAFILEEADFLQTDWGAVTVIYLCSTAFDDALMAAISAKINAKASLRLVFSLRPLGKLISLKFMQAILLEGTWDSVLCYIYGRP